MNAPIPLAVQLERASHAVARRKHLQAREEWLMYELDALDGWEGPHGPTALKRECGCIARYVKDGDPDGLGSWVWKDCEEAE